MSVILKRLEKTLNISVNSGQSFLDAVKQSAFMSKADLVVQHAKINIEYSVLCSQIAYEWFNSTDIKKREEQIKDALATAALLEMIYRDYLDVPEEVDRLQKEQALMRAWLKKETINKNTTTNTLYVSKWIRENTSAINLPRLIAVRARRLLMAIAPLTDATSAYHQSMQAIDQYAAPFFSHFSWLIFIPRIADHLLMIVKHTVEHDGMTEGEKALGWQTRFMIQLKARWPDLSNDLPWMIANVLSCFVLVGPLLPYNTILSICMQFYEIVQVFCIYYASIDNLQQQRDDYISARDQETKDSDAYNTLNDYIKHLKKRLDYDANRLWIPIINASALLLALILAAPIFAPGYAVVGAILAVSSSFGAMYAKTCVESQMPPGNLLQLLSPVV